MQNFPMDMVLSLLYDRKYYTMYRCPPMSFPVAQH